MPQGRLRAHAARTAVAPRTPSLVLTANDRAPGGGAVMSPDEVISTVIQAREDGPDAPAIAMSFGATMVLSGRCANRAAVGRSPRWAAMEATEATVATLRDERDDCQRRRWKAARQRMEISAKQVRPRATTRRCCSAARRGGSRIHARARPRPRRGVGSFGSPSRALQSARRGPRSQSETAPRRSADVLAATVGGGARARRGAGRARSCAGERARARRDRAVAGAR